MVEDKEHQPDPQSRKEQDEAEVPTSGDAEVQDPPVAVRPHPRVSPSLYGYDKSQWP